MMQKAVPSISRPIAGFAAPTLALLAANCAIAQDARFFPIPGQSAIPGSNPNVCIVSGTSGYSGTRISDDGLTVATVAFDPGFVDGYIPRRPARWTEAGGTVVLGPDVPGLYGVTGISADGRTIYGESWRWTAAGGYEDLRSRLTNGFFLNKTIFGCSSDGRTITGVTGTYPDEGDLFLWRLDDEPLVTLPRAASFPQGYFYFNTISGDGNVVAGSTRRFDFTNGFSQSYAAAVVTPSGANVITDESDQAGVTDLSFDGSVAVGYLTTPGGFTLNAFRWTAAGGITILTDGLGSDDSTYARATNADGSVVVGDYVSFGNAGTSAWIWRANSGFIDLQSDLINNFGLADALAGWRLLVATDVSADGRTIVGQGVNPDGCEQAFLVRLPGVCAPDFNSDGFIDFFDYDDFVNCFETGVCPPGKTADFNGDQFVDFFDYDGFVGAFEAGC
ncbi:MAG: hypothetical protein HEQ23_03855 [Tepidisphaera sp.]|jgi:hypothetical protein